MGASIELIWLMTGIIDGLLLTRCWTFVFHKIFVICRLAWKILTSNFGKFIHCHHSPNGDNSVSDSITLRWFFFWRKNPQWGKASSFTMFLDHTQRRTTVGRTPLDEWSARRRDLTTRNTHNRQTSMTPVGFETTISAGERPQSYVLDRAATGTGVTFYCIFPNCHRASFCKSPKQWFESPPRHRILLLEFLFP